MRHTLAGIVLIASCGSSSATSGSVDAPVAAVDARSPAEPDATLTAADAATGLCAVTDPGALVACAAQAQAGRATVIEIQGAITCSGPDACKLEILSPPGPITIRGAPGASVHRLDHHDYSLFHVVTNGTVVFSDLVIDENRDVPCVPISPTNPPVDNAACGRTIDIYGASQAVLERVTVAYSKGPGAFCNTCADLRVSGRDSSRATSSGSLPLA